MRVHPFISTVLLAIIVIILVAVVGIQTLRFVLEFPIWTCIICGLVLLFAFITTRR